MRILIIIPLCSPLNGKERIKLDIISIDQRKVKDYLVQKSFFDSS